MSAILIIQTRNEIANNKMSAEWMETKPNALFTCIVAETNTTTLHFKQIKKKTKHYIYKYIYLMVEKKQNTQNEQVI